MVHRLIRAQPKHDRMPELRERLTGGDIKQLEPFRAAMTKALEIPNSIRRPAKPSG
jgi:hypothetical protein